MATDDECSGGDRPEHSSSNTYGVLSRCVALERLMADVYFHLATVHRQHASMYRLWRKTAREEESHALQFEKAMACEDELGGLSLSVADADSLLDSARRMHQGLEMSPPGVVQALEMAVHLEECLADFHLARIASFPNKAGIKKLFEGMLAADRGHIESLQQALTIERARA